MARERKRFEETMLEKVDDDNDTFLTRVCFLDEATFRVSWKVNRHNCRIWGSENPRVQIENQRDSSKKCSVMSNRIIGFYSFAVKTVAETTYLDMLQLYAVPYLPGGTIYQQDGAPSHFANIMNSSLQDGPEEDYCTWHGLPDNQT